MADKKNNCQVISLVEACKQFVNNPEGTEGAGHIKPLHWYVASRLVIEGGFNPDYVSPHPPLRVDKKRKAYLIFDESVADASEASVFGGLKTKKVDVTVDIPGLGPCVAVSMKGTLKAFRNLTNRLEEAIGDCTNLHMAYTPLIYGFLSVLRANREGPIPAGVSFLEPDKKTAQLRKADTALTKSGEPTGFITGYHNAMVRLTGRKDLRDEFSRYEAVTVALISPDASILGEMEPCFPPPNSPLIFSAFFPTLYRQYDLRFVYGAPTLRKNTERRLWREDSPAFTHPAVTASGIEPRITEDTCEDDGLVLPVPTALPTSDTVKDSDN